MQHKIMHSPNAQLRERPLLHQLTADLTGCTTEAEIVQVLYTHLQPSFDYRLVELQVLEPSGWYHSIAVERGVLQDVRRSLLSENPLAHLYAYPTPLTTVVDPDSGYASEGLVWAPVVHQGRSIGAITYHFDHARGVSPDEIGLLEQIHAQLGFLVHNAYLNALTRNQALSLSALNAIARALSATHDELEVVSALAQTLSRLLLMDRLELVIPYSGRSDLLRWIRVEGWGLPVMSQVRRSTLETELVGQVLATSAEALDATSTQAATPLLEGGQVRGVMAIRSPRRGAYDSSTLTFLEQAAHEVVLALRNAWSYAALEEQRRRLESLHELDMNVALATDERQIAEAFFQAGHSFWGTELGLLVGHLEGGERLAGWQKWAQSPVRRLPESTPLSLPLLGQLLARESTTMLQLQAGEKLGIWPGRESEQALEIMATPIRQGERTVGWLACGRRGGESFSPEEVKFQESAAAVVAIALRSVRLHRANQQALAHTVRLQEVAGMAGQGLESVVQRVSEQALPMLDAAGAACWAFDVESRVMATGWTENQGVLRVLGWSGRTNLRPWKDPPKQMLSSRRNPRGEGGWILIPLWYADRLVGAIGAIFPRHGGEGLSSATVEFAGHAAVAIENARLAEETRGRVQVLEAIANFSDIQVGRPGVAIAELGRLVSEGLAKARGALWLREGEELVCVSLSSRPRVTVDSDSPLLFGQRRGRGSRQMMSQLREAGLLGEGEISLVPVLVGGQPAGLLSAELGENRSETRRLMAVLASQTGVALARVQLVEALDREAKTMDAVLSNSPLGVVLEGSDGRIDFANSAIERLYDIPVAELAGQTLSQLWERAGVEHRGEVDTEAGERLELRRGERVIEVRRVSIPDSGDQPPRELTLHEDVTQERSIQDAKDLMLRAIGHEVRSPAAAMRATIASILQWQEQLDQAKQRSLLESAHDQSQRLLGLVESQLIIAQLETGRFQPRPETVEIKKVAEETVGILAHRYGDRVRAIQVDLPRKLPTVECEPTHLSQVLFNLLGNALEYTEATKIRLTARAVSGQVEISVADNGKGVAADRVESLFSKLTPAGQKRARGGLGLGLYLCRLVVERSFGGKIWLEKSGESGTEFRFTIPCSPSAGG